MIVRHLQDDAPRRPYRVSPDERVELVVATEPVAPGQWVWVDYRVWEPQPDDATHSSEPSDEGRVRARWLRNDGDASYWQAFLGPFRAGARIAYTPWATSADGDASAPEASFRVATRLHVALMWHQHQPLYRDPGLPNGPGSYRQPWVRLHGIRDYYSMAALVAEHPDVHVTINLTPVLLLQLNDYLERGATDRALELTLIPAEELTGEHREELLATFFDADWHHQIYPHPRYAQLLEGRRAGRNFAAQDLRDLQMWFNLAWFAPEFREGDIRLATGETAGVRRYVEQARGFDVRDLQAMVAEQYKILRAIVPLHRNLQDRGQIEVATTPYYHPILPLLIDTDQATIDRPGTTHPPRFAHPEDARAQVAQATKEYHRLFGRAPRGMWPAEGAVSQDAAALFAEVGVRWIASDARVLERSGRWGYRIDDPDVLCQPYRVETPAGNLSIFFREPGLSDDIGFHYHGYSNAEAAAQDFTRQIRERFARRLDNEHERVLAIILDGENAWSAYPDDARPFLHALYLELERARDLVTVTFSECLDGHTERMLEGHPTARQTQVFDLFTGSWIDENGSAPGVDVGTWIGEPEENAAWALLADARRALEEAGATPVTAPTAYQALYAAEGSDWFWWLGDSQDSGHDHDFDDLFRAHLAAAYRAAGLVAPTAVARHLVPHAELWTFARPISSVAVGDRLTVRANCPGTLTWRFGDEPQREEPLRPVGGVMAGTSRRQLTVGPFAKPGHFQFVFRCTHEGCDGSGPCCRREDHHVEVIAHDPP